MSEWNDPLGGKPGFIDDSDRIGPSVNDAVEAFANAQENAKAIADAVLAEREACAKIAEEGADGHDQFCCQPLAEGIAAAIRARGTCRER